MTAPDVWGVETVSDGPLTTVPSSDATPAFTGSVDAVLAPAGAEETLSGPVTASVLVGVEAPLEVQEDTRIAPPSAGAVL